MRTTRFVSDGRVNCPSRGDIDVEECWFCPAVKDIRQEGDEEVVVCSPRAVTSATDDPLLFRL